MIENLHSLKKWLKLCISPLVAHPFDWSTTLIIPISFGGLFPKTRSKSTFGPKGKSFTGAARNVRFSQPMLKIDVGDPLSIHVWVSFPLTFSGSFAPVTFSSGSSSISEITRPRIRWICRSSIRRILIGGLERYSATPIFAPEIERKNPVSSSCQPVNTCFFYFYILLTKKRALCDHFPPWITFKICNFWNTLRPTQLLAFLIHL